MVDAWSRMRCKLACVLAPKRFDTVAKGFGAEGIYVVREEGIAYAVQGAIASGKLTVIHAPIDPVANAMDALNYEEFKS
jgi:thiamine pyrophosphate-dependent acetolactate synthase large subunit-like protein